MEKHIKFWQPILITLLVACIFVFPKRAFAHAFLERSEPADNVILNESPTEFRLWFSEPLSNEFSTAQVLDTSGNVVTLEKIEISAENPRLMILYFPPDLPEGAYSILWKVLSTADGHFTEGLLVFGVGSTADLSSATAVQSETAVPIPEIILRWLNFVALMGVVGAFVVVSLVLDITNYPLIIASIQSMARQRILRFAYWFTLFSIIGGISWLIWQAFAITQTLPDGTSLFETGWQWLSKTRLGLLWVAKQALLVIIFALLHLMNSKKLRSIWEKIALFILIIGVVAMQSLTSHAAALNEATMLAIVVDSLHFIAASIWVGGLLGLIIGFMPFVRQHTADLRLLLQAGWGPFGRVAFISVGTLIATGLYSTGRQVASIDALISTGYGQAISGKVLLLLIIGSLGFINAMLLHSGLANPVARLLRRPEGWRLISFQKMPKLILFEAALGLLVFLLTGYVTAAPTARGPQFVPASEIVTAQSQQIDDVLVNLSIKPNLPGSNIFTINASNIRRPPLAEIERVIVRLTYQDQDFGMVSIDAEEIEPGVYRVGGNEINVAGNWQVDVVVRRLGITDSVASFNWIVGTGVGAQTAIISNQDWQSTLSFIAAIVLLMVLAGIGFSLLRGLKKEKSIELSFDRLQPEYWSRRPQKE